MSVLKDILGIGVCADCGRRIYSGGATCGGFEIDEHRKAECWGTLCRSCTFKLEHRDEDGTLMGVENYCKYHLQWWLFQRTMNELEELEDRGSLVTGEKGFTSVGGEGWEDLLQKVINRKKMRIKILEKPEMGEKLERARDLEIARRFEGSASLYEELEMWEEAEIVRKKMNQGVAGSVHIDADDLFGQIERRGSIIPYKCPYCLGRIKIDGKERIGECPYCGTGLDLQALSSLVDASLE